MICCVYQTRATRRATGLRGTSAQHRRVYRSNDHRSARAQGAADPDGPDRESTCSNAVGANKISDCVRLTGGTQCDLATVLARDPFLRCMLRPDSERRGQAVFAAQCMSCHNTPNVFGNVDHIPGLPLSFPPRYGKAFDVGVAQKMRSVWIFGRSCVPTERHSVPSRRAA